MNIYTVEMSYSYEGSNIHSVVTSYEEAIESKNTAMVSSVPFDSIIIRQWYEGEKVWKEEHYR